MQADKIARLRRALLIFVPFIFLHFYLEAVYQLSLWQLISWWPWHVSEVEDGGYILGGLLALFLLFMLLTNSLIETVYLVIFGKTHKLVYLGNCEKNKSAYIDLNDPDQKQIQHIDLERSFNTVFDEIYCEHYFRSDRGAKMETGNRKNRFHPAAILAHTGFWLFFSILFLVVVHISTIPALNSLNSSQIDLNTSVDSLLAGWNLSREKVALIAFLSLVAAIVANRFIPDHKIGERVIPLPAVLKSGNILHGRPIKIYPLRKRIRDPKNPDKEKTIDTGVRHIPVELNTEFSPPVYISLVLDRDEDIDALKLLQAAIEHKKTIEFMVSEGLMLYPVTEKERFAKTRAEGQDFSFPL